MCLSRGVEASLRHSLDIATLVLPPYRDGRGSWQALVTADGPTIATIIDVDALPYSE
jgi:hypothetical protein